MKKIIITTLVILLGMQTSLSASAVVSPGATTINLETDIKTGKDIADLLSLEVNKEQLANAASQNGITEEQFLADLAALTPGEVDQLKYRIFQSKNIAVSAMVEDAVVFITTVTLAAALFIVVVF